METREDYKVKTSYTFKKLRIPVALYDWFKAVGKSNHHGANAEMLMALEAWQKQKLKETDQDEGVTK